MDLQTELREIIVKHCSTLREEAAAITESLDGMSVETADRPALLGEAIFRAHKIKGSSGTIGFGEVSERAKTLEMLLRAIEGSGSIPEGEISAARALSGSLNVMVADLKATDSTLYDADFNSGAG